ncbi:DUF4395 domain-containing protein [Mesobacillus harenae]|uniref:DUF4395 domain-containing protein n=1 Tax=Mesobacillus harenae TaxID=2213203 RepID=UPI001580CE1D|nr:DUF4395 domain-containing protein [Mesobacillus harenae]
MSKHPKSIPQPLVRTNQWTIVISILATWISGWEWLLAIPLITGLMGLFFGFNPIMRTAALFLKKHKSQYTPEDWDQQQFNQKIAVLCLGGGLISFSFELNTLGYILTAMVFLAAFIAILGFCVGCFIRFQWQQYSAKRRVN